MLTGRTPGIHQVRRASGPPRTRRTRRRATGAIRAAAKAVRTPRASPSGTRTAGTIRAEGNPRPAGIAWAPAGGRTSGTSRMASTRGMPWPRRTDRWQVGPRRRVLVVAVRAVGPGRGARRQELLLRHGRASGIGVRYVIARYAELGSVQRNYKLCCIKKFALFRFIRRFSPYLTRTCRSHGLDRAVLASRF